MEPPLTIYIDEAGDPGAKDGIRYLADRHEWLCLSAFVIRTERDADLVAWVRDLRAVANATQSGALHYARITKGRRTAVCSELAAKKARAFVLASHKSNLREYINPRLGAMIASPKLYNWCLRLLLERVTAWAVAWMVKNDIEPCGLRVVLAERGGHDYDHLFAYIDKLKMQAESGTLLLKGKGLHPALLDRAEWSVRPMAPWAGLQLADVIASSFYQAANSASPSHDVAPAQTLAPIVAKGDDGRAADFGVTVWPLPHQAPIPDEAKAIFRFYGYGW
jgi:Protein of unknown function (DUF3800)